MGLGIVCYIILYKKIPGEKINLAVISLRIWLQANIAHHGDAITSLVISDTAYFDLVY